MPDILKTELSRPYGFLFKNNNSLIQFVNSLNRRIITVGDVVTLTLRENGIIPFLSIIDGKTKRTIKLDLNENNIIRIKNEKSIIRMSTIKIIEKLLNENNKKTVLVDGEEDLLVIPVVLYGKYNDIVIYGQPNAGAVVIVINKFVKLRVRQIFEKFIVKKC